MRVLAADDDTALSRALERSLRVWGYEVEIASDGLTAWRALKREPTPGIVILDWDMPGMSGLEVCRLLRSTPQGASVYVLMLTGRQEKEDIILALEAGADDFLTKPFHHRELQLRLAKGVRDAVAAGRSAAPPSLLGVSPPTGTTLGGKFRLERKLADGGMSSVWLGVHLALGVNVAIKFMKPDLAETADYASFETEARAAAQLRNEHVVRMYDHGITHDGLPYLVMEYLGGESLGRRIDRAGALPMADLVVVVDQAAAALAEVHAHGLVHRDIKPENIVLVDDGDREQSFSVKLIDFGLAKRSAPIAHAAPTTVAGTPSYMSPEYLRGDVGPSAMLDLWGLAASVFTALTARVPFLGDSVPSVFQRLCVDPLPLPSSLDPSIPLEVDDWFCRACARDPSARYQSAAELAAAFRAACAGRQSTPRSSPVAAVSFAPTEPASSRILLPGDVRRIPE